MADEPKPAPKPAPPPLPQAEQRGNDGKFQTASDWMRNGGKSPTIRR